MQEIKKILSSKQNIVITTHVNPDGDAIGSSIALLNFLIKQGHNTSIIVPNDYPDFLKWMKNDELIIQCKSGARSARVCEFLIHQGFNNVKNLKGGILDWIRLIDPTQQTY